MEIRTGRREDAARHKLRIKGEIRRVGKKAMMWLRKRKGSTLKGTAAFWGQCHVDEVGNGPLVFRSARTEREGQVSASRSAYGTCRSNTH